MIINVSVGAHGHAPLRAYKLVQDAGSLQGTDYDGPYPTAIPCNQVGDNGVIREDVTLTSDLIAIDSPCLTISADSVTLDGNGYTIDGQGVVIGLFADGVNFALGTNNVLFRDNLVNKLFKFQSGSDFNVLHDNVFDMSVSGEMGMNLDAPDNSILDNVF